MVEKYNSITIAKAMGIVLMVIGHSGCPKLLFNFIYSFHMPLFFFCSGLFYKEVTSNNISLYLNKRVKRLYLPYIKWYLPFLFLHNVLINVGIYAQNITADMNGPTGGFLHYDLYNYIKEFIAVITMHGDEHIIQGFWFLRALFYASVLIAITSVTLGNQKFKNTFFFIAFLIATIVIRRYCGPGEIWKIISQDTMGAYFYLMGFIYQQQIWKKPPPTWLLISCVPFLLFSLIRYPESLCVDCGYNKVIPFTIIAFSGIILVLYFSAIIENKTYILKKALYYIGNQTLIILALHFLCFRIVSFVVVCYYEMPLNHMGEHPVIAGIGGLWWILYSLIGIVVPLMIKQLWKYITKSF